MQVRQQWPYLSLKTALRIVQNEYTHGIFEHKIITLSSTVNFSVRETGVKLGKSKQQIQHETAAGFAAFIRPGELVKITRDTLVSDFPCISSLSHVTIFELSAPLVIKTGGCLAPKSLRPSGL